MVDPRFPNITARHVQTDLKFGDTVGDILERVDFEHVVVECGGQRLTKSCMIEKECQLNIYAADAITSASPEAEDVARGSTQVARITSPVSRVAQSVRRKVSSSQSRKVCSSQSRVSQSRAVAASRCRVPQCRACTLIVPYPRLRQKLWTVPAIKKLPLQQVHRVPGRLEQLLRSPSWCSC